jgi:hypothetical protein
VETEALCEPDPYTRTVEAGSLETVDAARYRIYETARKVHSRTRQAAYLLAATNF